MAEHNTSTEVLSTGEQLVLAHEQAVQQASREAIVNPGDPTNPTGEVDGVGWSVLEYRGKQQPVVLADLTFPGGDTLPVVFRSRGARFENFYKEYPVVRQFYPKLYTSIESPQVLTMERIEGPHFVDKYKEYKDLVSTPEGLEALSQDMFEAVDALLDEPLTVDDVGPVDGHNVIYNEQTGKFQLFDVDTIRESDASHVAKFLDFLPHLHTRHEELGSQRVATECAFLVRMVQLYVEAHPETELSYFASDLKEVADYSETDEVYEKAGETLLYPGSEEYEEGYERVVNYLGTKHHERRTDFPVLKKTTRIGRDVVSIEPDVLKAIKAGDVAQVEKLVRNRQGYRLDEITTRKFVEMDT